MGLNSPIELKMTEAGLAAKENADSIIFTRFLAGSTGDTGSTSVTSIKQVIPINNYVKRIAGQEYIQDGVTQVANESFLSISGFANSLDAENEYVLNEIALMAKLDENGEEFCFAYDWSNSYKYRIRTDLSQPITVQYKIVLTRVPQLTINTSETGVTFSDLYAHTEKTVTQTPVHGLKCVDGVLTVNNQALHKSTVGLGNVDNTSDLDKPVSTAVQTELNGLSDRIDGVVSTATTIDGQIQDLALEIAEHKNDETNPHNVTAAQVGAAASNHTHTESDITDLGDYATNTDLNSYGVSSLSFDNSTSVLTITMKDNSTKTAIITGTGSSGSSGDGSSSGSTITLQDLGGASATDLTNHINDTNNPHNVTYSQTGAAAASHTHTESDITDLGNYASSSHTHTVSDITDANTTLANKVHNHTLSDITDVTATTTEVNYLSGVTANIQDQLNSLVTTGTTVTLASLGGASATDLDTYGVKSIQFDNSTGILTLTMKDDTTKTVTIQVSSENSGNSGESNTGVGISSAVYNSSTNSIIFTMSDNSTVNCDLSSLLSQVLTYDESIRTFTYNSEWEDKMTGTGTKLDPYLIYTPKDFVKINEDMSAHYKLMNNLDFATVIGNEIRVNESANTFTVVPDSEPWNCPMFNSGEGYRPIGYDGYYPLNGESKSTSEFSSTLANSAELIHGTSTTSQYYIFTGELDGNNKIIKGITSIPYNAYSVGLFSFVGNGAYIHHLTIKDSVFVVNDVYAQSYKDSSVASIAGDVCYTVNETNRVQINNVYSYATLISNRQTDGYSNENAKIGGIACRNNTSGAPSWIINKCSFRGKIIITNSSVRHQVTGIANYQNYSADGTYQRITNCINTANLPGTYIQGIGQNLGKVNINCGLLPETQDGNHFSLSDHRNTGYVNGKQYTIYDNLARDASTSESYNNSNNYYFKSVDDIKSKSFIKEANTLSNMEVFHYNDLGVDNGWPLLTDEYNTLADYDKMGLQLAVVDNTTNIIYKSGKTIDDLLAYESLDEKPYNSEWEDKMTGSGTELDPYLIYTPKDFVKINDDMSAHYKLMNNLDFATVIGMHIEVSSEGYSSITTNNEAPLFNNGEGFWPIGYNGYYPIQSNDGVNTSTIDKSQYSRQEFIKGIYTSNLSYIFRGELDGNSKVIKGIACSPNNTYAVALFSFLGEGSYIHNLMIKDSVFILNDVYTVDIESGLSSIGAFLSYYNDNAGYCTIKNVYNYATLINGRTTPPATNDYIYSTGIVGSADGKLDITPKLLVEQCSNHGSIFFVDQNLPHMVGGITLDHRNNTTATKVINCINSADLTGYSVIGIGNILGKANINCGTCSNNSYASSQISIYGLNSTPFNNSTIYIDGPQYLNRTNLNTCYWGNYSETQINNFNKFFKTTAELKSQEFIDEVNNILPEPVFAYNDLNLTDGWPLLIDEYNIINGIDGNLNLSLIDPTNNRIYKSGYSLKKLQKTVTFREVSSFINGQIDTNIENRIGSLKCINVSINSSDWVAEEVDSTPTGNYTATLSITGITATSPIQLMTQLTDLEIEINSVGTNSVTLICSSQPASNLNCAIMFI